LKFSEFQGCCDKGSTFGTEKILGKEKSPARFCLIIHSIAPQQKRNNNWKKNMGTSP